MFIGHKGWANRGQTRTPVSTSELPRGHKNSSRFWPKRLGLSVITNPFDSYPFFQGLTQNTQIVEPTSGLCSTRVWSELIRHKGTVFCDLETSPAKPIDSGSVQGLTLCINVTRHDKLSFRGLMQNDNGVGDCAGNWAIYFGQEKNQIFLGLRHRTEEGSEEGCGQNTKYGRGQAAGK